MTQISPRSSLLPPIRNYRNMLQEHVVQLTQSDESIDQITFHQNEMPLKRSTADSLSKQRPSIPLKEQQSVTKLQQWDRVPPLGLHTPPSSTLQQNGEEFYSPSSQLSGTLAIGGKLLGVLGGKRRRVEEEWHSVVLTYNNREDDVTRLR